MCPFYAAAAAVRCRCRARCRCRCRCRFHFLLSHAVSYEFDAFAVGRSSPSFKKLPYGADAAHICMYAGRSSPCNLPNGASPEPVVAAVATPPRLTTGAARSVGAVFARLVPVAEGAHRGHHGARRLLPCAVPFRPQALFLMPRLAPLRTAFAFAFRSLNPRGGRLHPRSGRLHPGHRVRG